MQISVYVREEDLPAGATEERPYLGIYISDAHGEQFKGMKTFSIGADMVDSLPVWLEDIPMVCVAEETLPGYLQNMYFRFGGTKGTVTSFWNHDRDFGRDYTKTTTTLETKIRLRSRHELGTYEQVKNAYCMLRGHKLSPENVIALWDFDPVPESVIISTQDDTDLPWE